MHCNYPNLMKPLIVLVLLSVFGLTKPSKGKDDCKATETDSISLKVQSAPQINKKIAPDQKK